MQEEELRYREVRSENKNLPPTTTTLRLLACNRRCYNQNRRAQALNEINPKHACESRNPADARAKSNSMTCAPTEPLGSPGIAEPEPASPSMTLIYVTLIQTFPAGRNTTRGEHTCWRFRAVVASTQIKRSQQAKKESEDGTKELPPSTKTEKSNAFLCVS